MIRTSITVLSLFLLSASGGLGQDQTSFSIEDILSPGFPSSLVSARHANRIAWIENERGMRNVYTATPPEYDPVRLTSYLEDDGVDLTGLQISDVAAIWMSGWIEHFVALAARLFAVGPQGHIRKSCHLRFTVTDQAAR